MAASADNLATFVDVVRHRSLSAAARNAGLPKSTISRRLQRLEAEVGDKLLQRDARKLALTAAGRRLFDAVVGPVDALGAALTSLAQSSQEPRGTIRVTAPADLGRMVLSPMLVAFLERYPEIGLDISYTNRMLDLVQEGVDVAVRAARVVPPELIARKLCAAELQLAASRKVSDQLDARGDIRSLEQQAFVLYRTEGGSQTIRLERTAGKSPKSLELNVSGRVKVDDYAAMAELIAAGHGLGLLPAIHVREGVQAGRLTRVFPDWSYRSGYIYLVYPARQRPERVRLLTEFLRDAFSRVPHV